MEASNAIPKSLLTAALAVACFIILRYSISMQVNTDDRTLNAWLKKDDKSLLKGIKDGLDVFEIGFDLNREPLSVLRHLDTIGAYECEANSEEEVELFGLALSGVPLDQAILWCVADKDRSQDIESMIKIGDMRPALHFAQDFCISIANADCLDELCWVMVQPEAKLNAAIRSIGHRFDVVTPRTLKEHLTDQVKLLTKDDIFPPKRTSSFGTWAPRRAKKTTTRKSRYRKSSSRASSSGWKFAGRRKSSSPSYA